ncbi:Thiol-disulfide isomerase or thioredoxin [Lutibacter agarilyticus]|uniref:Thiol-disulfide isomerase or thioredoxin n=1 Tax=Lutibacter agarilyticus TaxID=1109740 RepID=A0A238W5H5_9FLAO|nr:TlpA disulfide reductase family protein [Lutibacter agarilyticus]SNR41855.1 Thiol-disulfide isomerase or thioredoxin [Lutibacter agarilyticus]
MKKLLLIALFFTTQIGCAQEDATRGYKVKVGEQAPELNFTLMDGTQHTNESLKGKVVVLQFTASWCSVCRKEMPHLESKVWQQFKNEDFMLVGIDLKEDREKVERFIAQMQVTYPFTIDEDGSLFESFTLPKAGVTRNIVLDKNGEIIFLSRLYEEKEFNEMIAVITAELKK